MDYQRIYDQLIERAKGRMCEGYTESHHILPECLEGSNEPENLVDLYPEEHYVAHQLLVKLHPNHKGLAWAALMMTGHPNGKRVNNKAYGWLKRHWSQFAKDYWTDENRVKCSERMKSNNPNAGGKARKAYVEKHGRGPKLSKYEFSEQGRKVIVDRMKNDNPMAGKKPWQHSRATPATISVWKRADEAYEYWKQGHKSPYALERIFGFTSAAFMSMVYKYFNKGWIPHEDKAWLELKCKL